MLKAETTHDVDDAAAPPATANADALRHKAMRLRRGTMVTSRLQLQCIRGATCKLCKIMAGDVQTRHIDWRILQNWNYDSNDSVIVPKKALFCGLSHRKPFDSNPSMVRGLVRGQPHPGLLGFLLCSSMLPQC